MTARSSGLRVLMVLDGTISGGHLVQAGSTAAALRKLGIDVTVAAGHEAAVDGYDIVHSFGVAGERLREARSAGAAVVVTPIWWEYGQYRSFAARMAASGIYAARIGYSVARRGIAGTAARIRRELENAAMTFELADLLLPNSRGEAKRLRADFRLTVPMHVVPNGFDPDVFTPPHSPTERRGIVCVGRLEPHKNQLALIEELRGSSVTITIVGDEHPHHSGYAARCRASAGGNVTFVPAMPQPELVEVYREASAHVLPSWFETTGLVSLEAAAAGCAVVTTGRGYAREYFGDLASYCDPERRGSIRSAVEAALAHGPPVALRRHILAHYTWYHTACATLDAYESIRR